jgi:hypothetical protein
MTKTLPFSPPTITSKPYQIIWAKVVYERTYYAETVDDNYMFFSEPKTENRVRNVMVGVVKTVEDGRDVVSQLRDKTVDYYDTRWHVKSVEYRFEPVELFELEG